MVYRILHCGKSIENYNLCLQHHVVGFIFQGAKEGDTVFVAIRLKDKTVCGLKGTLGEPTDFKPWSDGDRYAISYMLSEVEYANLFDLKFLREIGGKFWSVKYLQGAKPIKDPRAVEALDKAFSENLRDDPLYVKTLSSEEAGSEEEEVDSEANVTEENIEEVLKEVPEAKITVMGTFQTVKFKNETDELRGLESLVNENFYALFPSYLESRTLLIPENRLFRSSGLEARGDRPISGIRSIPDGLLIIFNKQIPCPLQINLIEYECFGENRTKSQQKSNYLNGQVIPQLMKFASSFSIVTDKQIREQTVKSWVDKIVQYIFSDNDRQKKLTTWIKEVQPDIADPLIGREIDKLLSEAFKTNLKIMLVIDDLSAEQRDTIANVIQAFRLENGESISFMSYVVRLEQRISLANMEAEYALSVQ